MMIYGFNENCGYFTYDLEKYLNDIINEDWIEMEKERIRKEVKNGSCYLYGDYIAASTRELDKMLDNKGDL